MSLPLRVYDVEKVALHASHLWTEGWVVIPGLLTERALAELKEESIIVKRMTAVGTLSSSVTDELGNVLVINSLDKKSDFIFDFCRQDLLITLASQLVGKSAIPIHSEFFSKPGCGAVSTPAHQDQVFYNSHFDDEPAITFWCPLEEVGIDDGPLEYAIVVHLETLLPHKPSNSLDFGMELVTPDDYEYLTVPLQKGDCLVHHSYAVHKSRVKTSGSVREAFAFNFRGSSYRERLGST